VRGHIRVRKGPRGTTYQLVVYAGVGDDGRVRYLYETVDGSRRDAENRLAELVADVNAGRRGASRVVTVKALADAWWDAMTGHLSPNTRIGYRGVLDRHIMPTLGRRRIDKIKPADLDRWYAQLAAGSAPTSRKPMRAQSVRNVHNLLSGMFSTAVRWGWLPVSPVANTRPPRGASMSFEAPEPEDVARALAAAEAMDPELHAFLRFSAAVGTRRSETSALQWRDLDLDAGEVTIRRALAHDDQDPTVIVVKDTKTHATARLALDPETVAVLRSLRARNIENALACGIALAEDAFVFSPRPDGSETWSIDHFSRQWIRLRARLGLERVRLHDFRHFHGTELAAAGVPMTTVRDRLRHSNLRTTSIYAHGRRAADQAAAEAIGHALPRKRAQGDETPR
jgi:integrase